MNLKNFIQNQTMTHPNLNSRLIINLTIFMHMAIQNQQKKKMRLMPYLAKTMHNGMNQQRKLFIGNGTNTVIFLLSIFRLRMDALQKKC